VTAIPGAVFSGSLDGHLRGYSTANGKIIWDYDTNREFKNRQRRDRARRCARRGRPRCGRRHAVCKFRLFAKECADRQRTVSLRTRVVRNAPHLMEASRRGSHSPHTDLIAQTES
jgi:hypothetical protein